MSKLLVAKSCAPPADECPVRASGTRVINAPASSTGVHPHRSTGRLASVTAAAMNAVQRQEVAVSTRLAADQMLIGLRFSVSGCPETSDTVSGTNSAAHTAQTADAADPRRSAR